jgi:hypothetical protein
MVESSGYAPLPTGCKPVVLLLSLTPQKRNGAHDRVCTCDILVGNETLCY